MPQITNMTCQEYLDATKGLHGGWGYQEFHNASTGQLMLDGIKVKLSQEQIGEKMRSARQTISDWQEWDRTGMRPNKKREQANG